MNDPILLATRSAHKAREIRQILGPAAPTLLTPDEAGVPWTEEEEAIECFDTFLDNAHAKARWFMARTGMPTIADDSGISVHALDGRPGVRSRRFAPAADDDQDEANNQLLLRMLADVPDDRRSAHYTCAAVLHTAAARFAVVATRSGLILRAPRGLGGFGYDPIFLDPVAGLSFAEIRPEDKNSTSHRARAFRTLAPLLARPFLNGSRA